jgi:pseudaminic acid cytidylyltransferase
MNIAVIPARGGSKRIPRKNIKLFHGNPIISYSIRAAMDSGMFDKIIVSTDDDRIARTALEYGAEVPFYRPPELSDDYTGTAPVIEHALKWLAKKDTPATYVCCIYATAPFIQSRYIKEGFETLKSKNVSSVFSVASFPFPIYRGLTIKNQGHLEMIWPEHEMTRSNDLPEAYHDAGQFYWLECDRFLKTKKMYAQDSHPVILPRHMVQDIDTPEDWETAERMYEALQYKRN